MSEFIFKILGWLIDISIAYNPVEYLTINFNNFISNPLLIFIFIAASVLIIHKKVRSKGENR